MSKRLSPEMHRVMVHLSDGILLCGTLGKHFSEVDFIPEQGPNIEAPRWKTMAGLLSRDYIEKIHHTQEYRIKHPCGTQYVEQHINPSER